MRRFFPILVSFACGFTSMCAQQIRVVVKDHGNPIVGATVRILELDRVNRTNDKGEYLFTNVPNGRFEVFARVIGYASETRTVDVMNDSAVVTFEMHQTPVPGEEVIVSASPYPHTKDELYQSAESKSLVDFQESPGSSFAEKIEDLPGVEVRWNGSAPSRPMLRGLSDNRVLVLENGMRTGDISTYDPAHAVPIESESIEQIDVVRGPAAILFGPSTIGGLVNVITNTIPAASTKPYSGTLTVTGNSVSDEYAGYYNGIYSDAGHAIGVFAGGSHSQDIRIPGGVYVDPASGAGFALNRMPQSFNHVSDAGAGYSYQGDFGSIGIGGRHYEMNYGIPGVPPNADWMDVPPTTSRITQSKNTGELRGLIALNDPVFTQVKFSAAYVDYNHSEYPTAQDSTGISDPQANHFHNQTVNAYVQLQHAQLLGFRGTFGVWANIEHLTIEGDMPLGPNSTTDDFAAYLFEEYGLSEETRLQVGLRYDFNSIQTQPFAASTDSVFQTLDVSRSSNAVTASLGIIQRLAQHLTLSLSLARSFRPPTVQELYANGLDAASGTYSLGDAALTPESGGGIDAGLRGTFADFTFEVSPYVNFIHNYIYAFLTGDTLQAFPVRQFSATDARLMGFEASAVVQLVPAIALKASMDYVNAQDTKNKVPLPFTPPMRGLLRLNYQDNTYSGMLEWRLAASQTRLGEGDTPTPGYGIINIGAGVRLVSGGVVHNVSLNCDNLFDTVYRDHLSVIKDFLPQPGRGLRLTYVLLM